MEMKYWVCLALIIGLIIGYILGRKIPRSLDGVFRVDLTNPEKDVFTLELICPIAEIPTKKYLQFKVQKTGSQEKPFA